MKLKYVKRSAMAFAISASFILPHVPHVAMAANTGTASFPLDLFPEDNDKDDTGLFPTTPVTPAPGKTGNNNNSGNNNSNRNTTRPQSTSGAKMNAAKVPEAYSCPLFDNRPHAELIAAIDSLNKEVKASPECTGSPSAKSLEDNGKTIKESISALQTLMASQDAASVNTAQIEPTITAALTAVGNLGDIVNNNNFLNSKCGRQTMSTGKVLLALNDVINGLAPYALFAVSMNAALAPALPFVIGGAVATSGISAIAKMIDQNTLDMTNPEHRKAVLQNTCQFTKVAKKVRFMQLAQSGKIDKITQELEQNVELYNAKFGTPSRELSALLKYKDTATKVTLAIENQMVNDRADLLTVETQIAQNSDDLMVCMLSNELVNWAQDGKTFPSSAFLNLSAATAQGDRAQKLQAVTMSTLHVNSMKKIASLAVKATEDESALKSCANAGRSWLSGVRQAIAMTSSVVNKGKADLESELSRSAEYRQWKVQYARIEVEKVTIKRVEKAMQELSKDNSIIDRSELAQRMVNLKAGLFGSRSAWGFGNPPVLAWIDHTKKMHDQAISAFITGMRALRNGSYSLTEAGRGKATKYTISGMPYTDPKVQTDSLKISQALGNFNLKNLEMGSREHEIACQQLESAWLDWSASIDHLGAVQFFCDMIDPVLDVKMDSSVVNACRGMTQLNGTTYVKSVVNQAKDTLIRKGYQADANLVSQKLKALQCPMPAVSVMNQ
ncbi:hypothetical protein QJS83_17390 [Bdellovibrio sp. 22V]|uniref:hypothetical protein n=1 Tax=Bdellovibrio TaxID=958 RepID=UPI002543EA20|nr:hypothetical protein [Bdellovibrio sp. 22V]WII72240.1 hypothetical protein QJS83_17390 [Bdellovibrio sp. 22V]